MSDLLKAPTLRRQSSCQRATSTTGLTNSGGRRRPRLSSQPAQLPSPASVPSANADPAGNTKLGPGLTATTRALSRPIQLLGASGWSIGTDSGSLRSSSLPASSERRIIPARAGLFPMLPTVGAGLFRTSTADKDHQSWEEKKEAEEISTGKPMRAHAQCKRRRTDLVRSIATAEAAAAAALVVGQIRRCLDWAIIPSFNRRDLTCAESHTKIPIISCRAGFLLYSNYQRRWDVYYQARKNGGIRSAPGAGVVPETDGTIVAHIVKKLSHTGRPRAGRDRCTLTPKRRGKRERQGSFESSSIAISSKRYHLDGDAKIVSDYSPQPPTTMVQSFLRRTELRRMFDLIRLDSERRAGVGNQFPFLCTRQGGNIELQPIIMTLDRLEQSGDRLGRIGSARAYRLPHPRPSPPSSSRLLTDARTAQILASSKIARYVRLLRSAASEAINSEHSVASGNGSSQWKLTVASASGLGKPLGMDLSPYSTDCNEEQIAFARKLVADCLSFDALDHELREKKKKCLGTERIADEKIIIIPGPGTGASVEGFDISMKHNELSKLAFAKVKDLVEDQATSFCSAVSSQGSVSRRAHVTKSSSSSVPLFASHFHGGNSTSNLHGRCSGGRPKRKIKRVLRFDPASNGSRSKSPAIVKTGGGFHCPRCSYVCSYGSTRCSSCHLPCEYAPGAGVQIIRERNDVTKDVTEDMTMKGCDKSKCDLNMANVPVKPKPAIEIGPSNDPPRRSTRGRGDFKVTEDKKKDGGGRSWSPSANTSLKMPPQTDTGWEKIAHETIVEAGDSELAARLDWDKVTLDELLEELGFKLEGLEKLRESLKPSLRSAREHVPERELEEERRMYARSVRDGRAKADAERLEKEKFKDSCREKMMRWEYANRGRKKTPAEMEEEAILDAPVHFRVRGISSARSELSRDCPVGDGCTLCDGSFALQLYTESEMGAGNGNSQNIIPLAFNESAQELLNPFYRELSPSELDKVCSDDREIEAGLSEELVSRPSRTQERAKKAEKEYDKLITLRNTLSFVKAYNAGPLPALKRNNGVA